MGVQTRLQRRTELISLQSVYIYGASRGLLGLPMELHLEILSYFPQMPVPTLSEKPPKWTLDMMGNRHMTMAVLSQTCRALRKMYMPRLWQRIEAYGGMVGNIRPIKRNISRLLQFRGGSTMVSAHYARRELQVVTVRQPNLAQYVQVLNIAYPGGCPSKSLLQEMANALSALPNLHTVQLSLPSKYQLKTKSNPFCGRQYPQIRTLSLNQVALHFAQSCPEVRVIFPYLNEGFISFPEDCQKLEVMGLTLLSKHTNRISGLSNLRDVTLMIAIPSPLNELLQNLRSLPLLNTIRFRMDKEFKLRKGAGTLDQSDWSLETEHKEVEKRIHIARQILLESGGDNSFKKIIVTYINGHTKTFEV